MVSMATAISDKRQDLVGSLEALDTRLRWLSSWTIHNANHIRPKRDGLKVGGHQASCASMTAIMAALYFHALRPEDKVAVKPHAGPVLHAIHYLMGNQTLEIGRASWRERVCVSVWISLVAGTIKNK